MIREKKAFDALAAQPTREQPESPYPVIQLEEEIQHLLEKRGFSDDDTNHFTSFFETLCDDETVKRTDLEKFISRLLSRLIQRPKRGEKDGIDSLANLLEWCKTQEPIVVKPQTGTQMAVYSDVMPQAVIRSINRAKRSSHPIPDAKSTKGHTISKFEQKQGATAEVSLLAENALKMLQELDDYTTDVLLIHFEQWRDNRDEKLEASMTAEAIFKNRGLHPKTKKERAKPYSSGYRQEDYDEAYRRVEQLEQFWLTVYTSDIWSNEKKGHARKKIGEKISEGRLLVITRRESVRIGNNTRTEAWKFRLFEGLEELVDDNCFAYVSRKILGYDYDKFRMEKRIGLYSAIQFKMNHMNPTMRKVKTIIDTCHISFDKSRPDRFITRIHGAFTRLTNDGVFKDWNYLTNVKFDEKGKMTAWKTTKDPFSILSKARNYWDEYAELSLLLEPNPDIPKTKLKSDTSDKATSLSA